ncbi:MAG: threonine synthase, partial [Oscillospiraceae bacterium]|nr:threonine synthase [Oscillospiraceae bacterium]
NRTFYTTVSPSMDILVSSNLERLLFELSGKDSALIADYMQKLNTVGKYEVTDEIKAAVTGEFSCGCCDDDGTKKIIGETFKTHNYLIDTHTAVAYSVLRDYRAETGDNKPAVVVSTASPYKFCAAVLEALGEPADLDGLTLIDNLAAATGVTAPAPLKNLRGKAVRFTNCVEKDAMRPVVEEFLK